LFRKPWKYNSASDAVAGAIKFFGTIALDLLVGMDPAIAFRHSLLEAFAAMAFGAFGGLCVPPVLRRLRAYGVLDPETQKETS